MAPVDPVALGGMRRSFEVGLRIAPTMTSAVAAAKGLSAILADLQETPVRLAGLGASGSRVHITLAVSLGSIDDVRDAAAPARSALAAVQAVMDHCAAYDPAFVAIPARDSIEARIAEALTTTPADSWSLVDAVRELAGTC